MSTTIQADGLLAKMKILGQYSAVHTFQWERILSLFGEHQKKIDAEGIPKRRPFAKTLDQCHSTEVRQVSSSEQKFDLPQTFGHDTLTIPEVCFVCGIFYRAYYISSSSELNKLKFLENRISRFFEDKGLE